MGYTIKQKIDICLQAEAHPNMTQAELARWAKETFNSPTQPSQTTISRILSSKNDLVASKQTEFTLVRRRKRSNPILRQILTEWVTQSIWEKLPMTTPIIQSTANAIWTRLPVDVKNGDGIFRSKWCYQFTKSLNINLTGSEEDIAQNFGYKLNKIWLLDDKIELKTYLSNLIARDGYGPKDIFTIDEFQLFYSSPLDQIFDINSIDKGLKQSSSSTENSLTIMLGTNLDGSEKLTPLIVGKHDKFDVSQSSVASLKNFHRSYLDTSAHAQVNLMNKITETYNIFYKNNINKWITSTIFHNYLLTLEHKLANNSPGRKILIILDDSSTHRILNLKFNNIKLIYLKNNTNHKSPFNSLFNGVNFDYCPMNFGIVHEFKVLYRLQQYLEMINIQQRLHKQAQKNNMNFGVDYKIDSNSLTTDVLSESDYAIPLVKAIEWIKRAWESITPERVLSAWHRTHLINIQKTWPQDSKLILMLGGGTKSLDASKGYMKLDEIMKNLNVVLPWTTDELLGLVNERSKATLNYISIDEIVTSCLSESSLTHEHDTNDTENKPSADDNWVMSQMLNPSLNEYNDFQILDDANNVDTVSRTIRTDSGPLIPTMNNLDLALINPVDIPTTVTEKRDKFRLGLDNNMSIKALLTAADELRDTEPSLRHLESFPKESQTQLLKHKLSHEIQGSTDGKKRACHIPAVTPSSQWNDSLPSSASSSPYSGPVQFPRVFSGITYKSSSVSNLQNYGKSFNDKELLQSIIRIIEASQTGYLPLSKDAVEDLKTNLKTIQSRQEHKSQHQT
ncbi:DDE-domain-containing protein [Yamadazyma tenuis ATCC 10573]|uniref:DDE-domain-containing protein n=1 Tax=Candida tenuis (strain ATCC 10573 / BCRC 21748 / CBS 615 / JCM 9827 / NBRC 10315 / NRRL Y-1498 / VKM Y-70) TaxID=590646 RepID=G3BA44_CANTC|nr:DDE-domain-containing protein [Yamadazyma tenuis ATCC 10573]EGV62006.1 DDE-domain-containing protein [Yamadazyma tenuis ATCC 10573]